MLKKYLIFSHQLKSELRTSGESGSAAGLGMAAETIRIVGLI